MVSEKLVTAGKCLDPPISRSLIFSIKMSPTPLPSTFKNFSTPRFKLHALEIPTGIKLILITSPTKEDKYDELRHVYSYLYVPLVSSNIFCQQGSKISSKLFETKVLEHLGQN